MTIGEAAVSKQGAAGLTPGRPDEGVWAYMCIDLRALCGFRFWGPGESTFPLNITASSTNQVYAFAR